MTGFIQVGLRIEYPPAHPDAYCLLPMRVETTLLRDQVDSPAAVVAKVREFADVLEQSYALEAGRPGT